jgi:hypothetical protein
MAIQDDIAALRAKLAHLDESPQARAEALAAAPNLALALYELEVDCQLLRRLIDPEGEATEGHNISMTTIV